jgi:hypothetical protein
MFCYSTHFRLLVIALVPLSACSSSPKALDALQNQIQEEVLKQGGSALKQVICEAPKSGDGKLIQCVGLLESGSGFDITAQKQDDQRYKWEILSIKGLLNISQIQRSIQDGLKAEVGEVSLDCGVGAAIYKVANPGDTFDCQFQVTTPLVNRQPAANKSEKLLIEKTGKVTISIMPSGDISWQRIVADKSDSVAGDVGRSIQPSSKSDSTQSNKIEDAKDAAKPSGDAAKDSQADRPSVDAPAPAQSADDALNQAGALDNLED